MGVPETPAEGLPGLQGVPQARQPARAPRCPALRPVQPGAPPRLLPHPKGSKLLLDARHGQVSLDKIYLTYRVTDLDGKNILLA